MGAPTLRPGNLPQGSGVVAEIVQFEGIEFPDRTLYQGIKTAPGSRKSGERGNYIVNFYDFDTSDQEDKEVNGVEATDTSDFCYVSNPVKLGLQGYKHIEKTILRVFGEGVRKIQVRWFGNLTGKQSDWRYLGGGVRDMEDGKFDGELAGMTLRRLPRSVRYLMFTITGRASKLQIAQLEVEFQQKYGGKLR